ncbi:hypothetical protein [Tardiphaga sp.]|uniref:hypothetical protein n=1 Tax=Tardiphaga sp. TaxID=1926292 RepID=UPI0026195347|nr:hypothetical protein [Tardiphaga sp.]MDB5616980.1 hypothetical protein [Tardiphaga sp.]
MRRFLVFLLLGPLIGFAVFAVRDVLGGKIFGGPIGLLVGLPFAYVFGLPIVLVMWFEDWLLEGWMGLWPKLLTSAVTGYVAVIALLVIATTRQLSLRETLTFGIVGAIPAVICSWLARSTPRIAGDRVNNG